MVWIFLGAAAVVGVFLLVRKSSRAPRLEDIGGPGLESASAAATPRDAEAIDGLLGFFMQIQDWPEFKRVEKEVVTNAGRAELLVGDDGRFVEDEWLQVKETVPMGDLRWEAKLYRLIRATEIPGSKVPIPFTALRFVCPEEIKSALRAGASLPESERGDEYGEALFKCSVGALAPSREYIDFLVGISQALEDMYAPKDYLFVPSMTQVAMLPHYDYDIVVFLISGAYLNAARKDMGVQPNHRA